MTNEYLHPDLVSDILGLAGIKADPEELAKERKSDLRAAVKWAGACHLAASDNVGVKIPKKPKFLDRYPEIKMGDGIWPE